jgi:hypothetical protein
MIPPQVAAIADDPVLQAAAEQVRRMGQVQGNPLESLAGLHQMKLVLDSKFSKSGSPTSLQNFTDMNVADAKRKLLGAIGGTDNAPGVSPAYEQARRTYAEMSAPVNQATVMQQARNAMVKPGEGGNLIETPAAFLSATEPGRSGLASLLKRADQSPRFTQKLSDVLDTPQMLAIRKNRQEFTRDGNIKLAADQGQAKMLDNLLEARWDARLPSFFNKFVTLTNQALRNAEDGISKSTRDAISKGMQSGKTLNELMKILPSEESEKVLRALTRNASKLAPAVSAGATTAMN